MLALKDLENRTIYSQRGIRRVQEAGGSLERGEGQHRHTLALSDGLLWRDTLPRYPH